MTRIAAARAACPDAFVDRDWRWYARIAAGAVLVVVFFWGLSVLGFSLERLARGLARLGGVAAMMMPPTSGGLAWTYVKAVAETVAMAFIGTLVASIVAVPLGFLGAKNTMPLGPLRFFTRRSFDVVRGLDSLIWAIVFVSVIGLGPFAGILAIAVNDTGVLAKLYAEAIENADADQSRGVRATGAGRLQVMRFSILPQVLPVFLSNTLYFFESNVRSATILGVVGAGGIGFYLMDRILINAWPQVAFIIILILITVGVIDALSYRIRRRLI
ncbi:phosphonate ABC transporter, permease protein PhnE [Lacimonas salitolerans]|uniref:Phosphonate ABC transporter, permease protein PhnE n=1 Tax=Lacimonas salitolerans TaxID=1323750 RepID=A0ABW4ECV8_9RHOB